MTKVNSLPLNTSILKNKTSVSRFKLDSSSSNSPPHPGKVQTLHPWARIAYKDRNRPANVVNWQAMLKRCLTFKKFAGSEVFYQIVDFLVLYTCSKYIIDRKGKNFSRLLGLQTVSPNVKSCSEAPGHNQDRPTDNSNPRGLELFSISLGGSN